MTTSCIGSATNAYQPPTTDGFNQLFQDFTGIGNALQTGDLNTAQSDLTSFQSDLQSTTGKNPLSKLFNNNPTLSNDLTTLQNALKSNDTTGAQNAFKSLMQDMQSAMKTQKGHRGHHHHHRVDNDGNNGGTTSSPTSSSTGGTADTTSVASAIGGTLNAQA
jgi:hypothetical protein